LWLGVSVGVRGFEPRAAIPLAHQPLHALAVDRVPFRAQQRRQAPRAEERPRREHLVDPPRANGDAPGVDGVTFVMIEAAGLEEWTGLGEDPLEPEGLSLIGLLARRLRRQRRHVRPLLHHDHPRGDALTVPVPERNAEHPAVLQRGAD
jgi:hypothetical protein